MTPGEWRTVPVRDLCLDIFDGPHATPTKTASGPIFLGISSLDSGRLDLAESARLSEDDFARWTRRVVPQPDDVVFSYETRLGEAAIIPEGLRCCLGRRMALMRPDPSKVDPRFLLYAFLGPEFQETIRERTIHGSTVERILLTEFADFPMSVPDLDTQRGIVALLGALDDEIDVNRLANRSLESIARAIFKSWFVDFDPVRKKMEGAEVGLPPDLAALFPSTFAPSAVGPAPEGWRISTVRDTAVELETGSRPAGGVSEVTEGVPSIGAESIVGIGRFDFAKTKRVPSDFWAGMRRGHVQNRDVLVYKDGGRPGMFEPHVTLLGDGFPFDVCCINEHVYRLRVSDDLSQAYIYFWLSSSLAMSEMRERGTGVAIPSLNSTAFGSVPVLVPSRPVVQLFTQVVEPLVAKILRNAGESHALSLTREALLPKLLSGELAPRPTGELP